MTKQYYSEKEDLGSGGFFLNNIRNWIIKECIESGDPEAFFENLVEVVEELEFEDGWLYTDMEEE